MGYKYSAVYPLMTNIAMEIDPFIDDVHWFSQLEITIYGGFSMAVLNIQPEGKQQNIHYPSMIHL